MELATTATLRNTAMVLVARSVTHIHLSSWAPSSSPSPAPSSSDKAFLLINLVALTSLKSLKGGHVHNLYSRFICYVTVNNRVNKFSSLWCSALWMKLYKTASRVNRDPATATRVSVLSKITNANCCGGMTPSRRPWNASCLTTSRVICLVTADRRSQAATLRVPSSKSLTLTPSSKLLVGRKYIMVCHR